MLSKILQFVSANEEKFLEYSWYISLVVFVLIFTYVLIKNKDEPFLKKFKKHSTWMAVIILVVSFTVAQTLRYRQTEYRIQAEADIIPTNLKIVYPTPNTALVKWLTNKSTFQTMEYRKKGEQLWLMAIPDYTVSTKYHTVLISNLEPGTYYETRIVYQNKIFTTVDGASLELLSK